MHRLMRFFCLLETSDKARLEPIMPAAITNGASGSSNAQADASKAVFQDSFFKPLEQGASTLKRFLQDDSVWPDLADHLGQSSLR